VLRNLLFPCYIPVENRLRRNSLSCDIESLLVHRNRLEGPLPEEIGNLNLQVFQANNNNFSGDLPVGLYSNVGLLVLRLENNEFTGTLGQEIGNIESLVDLRLSDNRFEGQLPVSIYGLSQLGKFLDAGFVHVHRES